MPNNLSKKIKAIGFFIGVIVISLSLSYLVLAWTEPASAPPAGNVSTPLNISSTGQSKQGGLILNTGGAATGLIVDKGNVGIGTTTPSQMLTVAGTIESTSGGFKFPDGSVQVMAGSGIPSGAIIMWGGTLANIPSGWKLCDGTSGTPDLRDKFIYGTSAGENPGKTGGNTVSNWPKKWVQTSFEDSWPNVSGSKTLYMPKVNPDEYTVISENVSTPNGTIRAQGGAYTDLLGGGGGPNLRHLGEWERLYVDNDFLPPFYKLAFICKL